MIVSNLVFRVFVLVLVWFVPMWNLCAEPKENLASSEESVDKAMQDLLMALDEETKIATHTKMNIDFVPNMVTVLHGQDLLEKGARTVYDALGYVPGVEMSAENDGQRQVIVRGVGRAFSSSKIKILLNGVPFNATLQAAAAPLILPIELVDRIEVIRGPGSARYGEFASVGVVNIITHRSLNQVFARRSDKQRQLIGGQYSTEQKDKQWDMNLSFSQEVNSGGRIDSGEDLLYDSPLEGLSNAPGPVNDAADRNYVALNGHIQGYEFTWQRLEHARGDSFGAGNALPSDQDKLLQDFISENAQIKRSHVISKQTELNYQFGWMKNVVDSKQFQIFPVGFPSPITGPFTDGVLGAPHYEEDKHYASVEVNYTSITGHALLAGLEYSSVKQGDTYAERNYTFQDTAQGKVLVEVENKRYSGDENWIAEGLQRRLLAFYIQDEYLLTKKLRVIAGFRYDDYDDIGSGITPRLASVYQLAQHKTLKLQFAQSFRPPTFLEMYSRNNAVVEGNPDLESERLNNVEFGYAYNNVETVARATVFQYRLRNLIEIDRTDRLYKNVGEVTAKGLELEYEKELNSRIKWQLAFSYVNAQTKNGDAMPGVASRIFHTGIRYSLLPKRIVSLQYQLISEREREPNDPRGSLDGYHLTDITFTGYDVLYKGLALSVSIANLFDTQVVYPANMASLGSFGDRPAYQDDYPQLGREVSFSIRYDFN